LLAVIVIVGSFGLLAYSSLKTSTGGPGKNATATARSIATTTATTQKQHATATAIAKGCQASANSSFILQFCSFNLTIKDVNGLLNDSSSAINDVELQIKKVPSLQGRDVGLAIIYGGAPTDSYIGQAQSISQKIYSILPDLGQKGFAFSKASYYVPLYILGNPSTIVRIDAYLFTQNSSSTARLDFKYQDFKLKIQDVKALLSTSPSAIADINRQIQSISWLHGRQVGLAMVYGGAPSDSDISQAQEISDKIYSILAALGKQGPIFAKAAFYDPLFALAASPSIVSVDVFLYSRSVS
jgi:hypothetical protein